MQADFTTKLRLEERIYRLGSAGVFLWDAPKPIDPEGPAPRLSIHYPDGLVEVAMTPIGAKAIGISGVDGRTLTPSDPADLTLIDECTGRLGSASLDLGDHGMLSVRIDRIDEGHIGLADFPSRSLDSADGGTLTPTVWMAQIPARATKALDVVWDVAGIESGILSWAPRPFSTGLTHQELLRRRPSLASEMSSRQADLGTAILSGLEELRAFIRSEVASDGLREHDLLPGLPGMLQAHIDLTLAHFLKDTTQQDIHRDRVLGSRNVHGVRVGGSLRAILDGMAVGEGDTAVRHPTYKPPRLGNFAGRSRKPKPR